MNEWATGEGDAIPFHEIKQSVTLPGAMPAHMENYAPLVSALDMGAKHDHAAHVVLGLDWRANRFRLASVQSWNPRDYGGTIPFDLVRQGDLEDLDKFRVAYTVYDRWQAMDMAQTLRSGGHAMIDCPNDPKAQNAMAVRLLEVFHSGRIDLYDHAGLIRDLSRMSIVERIHGFKIEAPRDEHGHADRGMSLAMLLPFSQQWNVQLMQHHLNPEPEETIIVS